MGNESSAPSSSRSNLMSYAPLYAGFDVEEEEGGHLNPNGSNLPSNDISASTGKWNADQKPYTYDGDDAPITPYRPSGSSAQYSGALDTGLHGMGHRTPVLQNRANNNEAATHERTEAEKAAVEAEREKVGWVADWVPLPPTLDTDSGIGTKPGLHQHQYPPHPILSDDITAEHHVALSHYASPSDSDSCYSPATEMAAGRRRRKTGDWYQQQTSILESNNPWSAIEVFDRQCLHSIILFFFSSSFFSLLSPSFNLGAHCRCPLLATPALRIHADAHRSRYNRAHCYIISRSVRLLLQEQHLLWHQPRRCRPLSPPSRGTQTLARPPAQAGRTTVTTTRAPRQARLQSAEAGRCQALAAGG